MRRAMLAAVLFCAVLALATSGCRSISSVTIGSPSGPYASHGGPGHGPPPHAPAHGYRTKHRQGGESVDLVFDAGLGVYVVVDLPDHFYWEGRYLRVEGDTWYASVRLDDGWEPVSASSLPPGLRKKAAKAAKPKGHPGNGKSKGKAKGHGPAPAKGRW